jgi:predicted RNase H-like nuclease (RuvC/YqgF family)
MNKLKQIWGYIVVGIGALIGVLLYVIQFKQKKINILNAKIELANTQKQADLIEVEIKQHMVENATLDKEIKALQDSLSKLAERRKQISKEEKNKTSDEVEDFWSKK